MTRMGYSAAWLSVAAGLSLGGCGDTAKTPPELESACSKDDCPDRCTPNRLFCHESQVWQCTEEGDNATLVQGCSTDETCSEQGEAAACEGACVPGQAVCDGEIATRCNAEGSGLEPEGQDCAETDQICELGKCEGASCVPGQRLCRDGDVVLCAASGDSVTLVNDCKSDRVCDPDFLVCAVRVCVAGELGCDGTRVSECNETGTRWKETAVDCATQNQLCIKGQCETPTCELGAKSCIDNAIYSCNQGALDFTLLEPCASNHHCVSLSSTEAVCYLNNCIPAADVCHNNILKVCSEDGAFPADGKDCGDEVCENAECQPKVCEVGEYSCEAGDVHSCPFPGSRTELSLQCKPDTSCAMLETNLDCVARLCEPSVVGSCVANALGTCKSDGQGLLAVSKNCATTGDVCNAVGACAKSAVDALGLAEDVEHLSSGEIVGNVFDVHSSRRLVKIEVNLLLDAPRDLRWVVYEWSGTEFVPRLSDITTNQTGSSFFSSGPVDYELLAGKRYLVGVGLVAGEGYVYYDGPPLQRTASFGYAVNGNRAPYGAALYHQPSENLYRARVTTELP